MCSSRSTRLPRTWLTNGRVAWQIPPGRIANFFRCGLYVAPESWEVERDESRLAGWKRGECGEIRKEGE